MSVLDRITSVKALPKVLSMLVYGRSGTGKTTFGASFPTPALLIDIREKGTDSIADRDGVDVVSVNTWSEVEEVFWYLKKEKKYKSVILDQISSLQDLCMEHAMVEEGKEIMSQRLWGVVSGMMKTWLLNYRDLVEDDINVLFIAHDRASKGESGEDDDTIDPQIGARLMPSVAGTLNGAVKAIGNTYVREVFLEDKSRKVEYCMRIGPHAYYTTKMRNPLGTTIPDHLVDPQFSQLMMLMSEGEKKPIRKSLTK
ncbi:MAG TPA: AAA family ATPase [Bacteroidales bacterium]|nr:AAA family ATPase [Bacteroidales bacterium]